MVCRGSSLALARRSFHSEICEPIDGKQSRVESADVIVVALDADGARTLEASDLVHGAYRAGFLVFADPPCPGGPGVYSPRSPVRRSGGHFGSAASGFWESSRLSESHATCQEASGKATICRVDP